MTHKQIFVSQSEKDMSRNRGNRRLIAMLDGVKLKPTELPTATFCPHITYCTITSNKKCIFGEGYKVCRVSKFYDRNPHYRGNNGEI